MHEWKSRKQPFLWVTSCLFVFTHFEHQSLLLVCLQCYSSAPTFYQLSWSLEPTEQSFSELRLVLVTLLSLADNTWSQISKRDGLISKLQISSSGQANANSCSFTSRGENVITKPAFLAAKTFTSPSSDIFTESIRMVNSSLCSHEWKRKHFHTAAVTNLIPGPQISNLDWQIWHKDSFT